jgi:two-component system cell cycle response regulator
MSFWKKARLLLPHGIMISVSLLSALSARLLPANRFGSVLAAVAGISLATSGATLLHKFVLGRFAVLNSALAGIEQSGDISTRIPAEGEDLAAELGRTFNRVLEKLETTNRDLRVAHDALLFQTSHDPVTGVLNRSSIMGMLARELARADREGNSISVMLVDVDGFKKINEEHGHEAGDAVLKMIGARLRTAIRPYDQIGRYGADDFLVIAPGCKGRESERLARRLRDTIRAAFAPSVVQVTVSIGVTVATGREQAATVVAIADSAMFRAKQSGRDRVEFVGLSLPNKPKTEAAWRA